MISAEAPILFAKACELFIKEITFRADFFTKNHKRKTLQKIAQDKEERLIMLQKQEEEAERERLDKNATTRQDTLIPNPISGNDSKNYLIQRPWMKLMLKLIPLKQGSLKYS